MNNIQNGNKGKVLHSWKEIASYVGRGVRTIQRYERQFGLPVHRVSATSRNSVLAFADEVDAWLRQTPILRQDTFANGICPLCSGSGMLTVSPSANSKQPVRQAISKEKLDAGCSLQTRSS